jgi:hypothetical protein
MPNGGAARYAITQLVENIGFLMVTSANWQTDVRAAAGGSDPTLRLALLVRSRHMRSGYVSRVCTMSSRLGIRSRPDDNESVADRLAFLLDCYGHQAAVAYDGETALRLLSYRRYRNTKTCPT